MTAHRDALVARVTAVLERVGQRNADELAEHIVDHVVLAPLPVDDRVFIEDALGERQYLAPDRAEVASMTFVSPDMVARAYPEVLGSMFAQLIELLHTEAAKRDRVLDPTRPIAVQCRAHTVGKRGLL